MQKQNRKIIGFNLIEVIIIIVVSALISAIATGIIVTGNQRTSSGTTYAELLQDENIKSFLDVYSDVVNGYYEDVDKNKAIESAISGMMDYLGDKYTTYLNDSETSDLTNSLQGKYTGIGISISSDYIIQEVFDNTPASEAGLKKDDKIISVNGVLTEGLEITQVTDNIKNSNSDVELVILRNNQEINIKLQVKEINKPAIVYSIQEKDNKKIGYLFISTFSSTLGEQVQNALEKLESQNIDRLIIDLRGNGGGYLTAAEETASLFLEKDKVIYSLETKDEIKTYNDQTNEKRDYKIVVLVNKGTASAAEILTSALKDSYGATIVGDTTYGKGKVQQTKTLSDGTMVKYTTAKWLRPNGECVDQVGITPDIEVSLSVNEDGEVESDNQLEKAIEVILQD